MYSSKVLYVPDLGYHLLSVKELCKLGSLIEFSGEQVWIQNKESRQLVSEGYEEHGVYKLQDSRAMAHYLPASSISDLWHARYGHLNFDYLRHTFRQLSVKGMPDIEVQKRTCSSCLQGKQHREPFPKKASRRATQQLELVHMDLCGPMQNTSLGGSEYFMLIIDDFSRLTWVFFLKHKSEAFLSLKEWVALVEKESGHSVKTIKAEGDEEILCR